MGKRVPITEEELGYIKWRLDKQALSFHDCVTLVNEVEHLRQAIKNFVTGYESVDDTVLNGYGIEEIDIAFGKLKEAVNE